MLRAPRPIALAFTLQKTNSLQVSERGSRVEPSAVPDDDQLEADGWRKEGLQTEWPAGGWPWPGTPAGPSPGAARSCEPHGCVCRGFCTRRDNATYWSCCDSPESCTDPGERLRVRTGVPLRAPGGKDPVTRGAFLPHGLRQSFWAPRSPWESQFPKLSGAQVMGAHFSLVDYLLALVQQMVIMTIINIGPNHSHSNKHVSWGRPRCWQ